MKEKELRERAICANCGKPFGHTGLPFFWTVTIQRYGLQREAIRAQDGLAAVLGGNSFLAQMMGPNPDLAKSILGPITLTLCEDCACEQVVVAVLAESAEEDDDVMS